MKTENANSRWTALVAFFLGAAFLAGCAGMGGTQDTAAKEPTVLEENVVTVTATVEAVDLAERVVTLRWPDGEVRDVAVDESVQNLPQVDVGDQVAVTYYESIAAQIVKPGTGEGAAVQQAVMGAKPGEKPGKAVVRQTTVTATIEAIDRANQKATLKGPEGKSVEVKVKNPAHLERVKVGDEVMITYTEALAISVEEIGN